MRGYEQYQRFFLNRLDAYQDSLLFQITNPGWGNVFYMVVGLITLYFVLEYIFPWKKDQLKWRRGVTLDIFYTAFNYILFWFLLGYAICDVTAIVFRDFLSVVWGVTDLSMSNVGSLPKWLQLVLLFVIMDFFTYWGHILLHKVPFLWKIHKVHHCSSELDVFNSAKGHIIENLFYPFILYIPLAIAGFNVSDTFIISFVTYLFAFFTHCNIKLPLGLAKYVFNNPEFHIWHHDAEVRGKDGVNFGNALSIWDFFFGTAYLPEDRDGSEIRLGFHNSEEYPQGFISQQLQPFKEFFRKD